MAQNYTSANTSINSSRLPAVYKKYRFTPGIRVLDYGCGKYTDHIRSFMSRYGCEWFGYDKYNQSDEVNMETLSLMNDGFDVGICSNVLNVIDDLNVVMNIIKEVKAACTTAVFFIYEGNKSGKGGVSKYDCWQRNESVDTYVRLMKSMGYSPTRKGNMICI